MNYQLIRLDSMAGHALQGLLGFKEPHFFAIHQFTKQSHMVISRGHGSPIYVDETQGNFLNRPDETIEVVKHMKGRTITVILEGDARYTAPVPKTIKATRKSKEI